ncbi:unnamed protein product, partial [Mesorhabditis spiculigera]
MHFLQLPLEVHYHLLNFLDLKSCSIYSTTCRKVHALIQAVPQKILEVTLRPESEKLWVQQGPANSRITNAIVSQETKDQLFSDTTVAEIIYDFGSKLNIDGLKSGHIWLKTSDRDSLAKLRQHKPAGKFEMLELSDLEGFEPELCEFLDAETAILQIDTWNNLYGCLTLKHPVMDIIEYCDQDEAVEIFGDVLVGEWLAGEREIESVVVACNHQSPDVAPREWERTYTRDDGKRLEETVHGEFYIWKLIV